MPTRSSHSQIILTNFIYSTRTYFSMNPEMIERFVEWKDAEPSHEDWLEAGKIASTALAYGKDLIKPGVKVVDILDDIEKKIYELGGITAFPAQISANDTAAHFCPLANDEMLCEDQILCLDVGANVKGAIGDNAVTIDLSGKWTDLLKASRAAVEAVEKMLGPGIALSEVGKTIQETIQGFGFSPVKNLSGHGLGPWNIHTDPSVPNFDNNNPQQLKPGMYIAVEPFATNGKGMIHEGGHPTLFSVVRKKPIRGPIARNVLNEVLKFNGLPFTTRWLTPKFSEGQVRLAFRELLGVGILHEYPPLIEDNNGMVSQAENSFFIDENSAVRLTKH